MITLILANQYPDDADSIILTGFLHNYAIPEDVFTKLYPANLDPRFSHLNLDADYLTTIPNSRGELFYYLPMADPAVIEVDEQNKETMTWAKIANIVSIITSTQISRAIKVPVLLVISQFDGSFCGGQVDCSNYMDIVNHEQDFFSPEACLEVVLIPQSGHVLNLQRNAPMAFANMLTWTDQHIGVEGKNKRRCH